MNKKDTSLSAPTPSGAEPLQMEVPDLVALMMKSGFTLSLGPADAALLAGMRRWREISHAASVDESDLRAVFRIIDELNNDDPATRFRRASMAISRLVDQKLILRIDNGGIAHDGSYTLSPLGEQIVDFVIREDVLTRQSLEILFAQICANLSQIEQAATQCRRSDEWTGLVIGPIREVVATLVKHIDNRATGLDRQQADVRRTISESLSKDWFDAIATCEELLTTTTATLVELHRALTDGVLKMDDILTALDAYAQRSGAADAVQAIREVQVQGERIAAWGKHRHEAWSQYYQGVHDFLQTHVRADPDRVISGRLLDAIKRYPDAPWRLHVCGQPDYRYLREIELPRASSRKRLRMKQTGTLESAPSYTQTILDRARTALLAELETNGIANVVVLLERFCEAEEISRDQAFRLAGDLITLMAAHGTSDRSMTGDWTPVACYNMDIQNYTVRKRAREKQ